ncbi:hypothetical protein Pmar_PMAR015334 [Perkinsus marinus ATCC 50983]|uniref:Uncharacterized protein n=1 Tax=Perkinsus marinus (strain ATCC 50983 / TXsc) TaxID=423536 RepID=C5KLB6_PERM5|nr:hypothetical protein Pmar_PMAR015334 [Perkinsus marinus ATCC 50983]EER14789.1 hypothetical protein Pmar_PMAR015334 [Perkinsus marinus ATCC 50983]|eukprot:XP_002782993.1 hypothetical protein Pmar_PMAR015334 [Perkinsus marinus ATCC 50983]
MTARDTDNLHTHHMKSLSNLTVILQNQLPIGIQVEIRPKKSPMLTVNERVFWQPGLRAHPAFRASVLNGLEPTHSPMTRLPRTYSGMGSPEYVGRQYLLTQDHVPEHLRLAYDSIDTPLSSHLATVSTELFPHRQLAQLCEEFETVWHHGKVRRGGKLQAFQDKQSSSQQRGPYPYVEEAGFPILDLFVNEVLYTKHRFKQRQHPKWNVWKKFKSRCRRRYSGREAVLNRKKLIAWKFRVQNKNNQIVAQAKSQAAKGD